MTQERTRPPPLADIDIRLLRVFRAVTECRGFARAESVLNIGRSTISAQMSALENRLGVRLCQRGPGGFTLTAEGQEVYVASTRLFLALDEFRTEITRTRGIEYIDIGIVDNTITDPQCPVIGALTGLLVQYPRTHVRVHTLAPDAIERGVIEGRFDVGIIPRHADWSGLFHRHLYAERNLLFCARRHPWFDPRAVPDDVSKVPGLRFVLHGYKHMPLERASNFGFVPDATVYSVEGIAMLILTGHFVGFLPEHYAEGWLARGEMALVRPERFCFLSDMELVCREATRRKAIVRALIETLDGENAQRSQA